MTHEEPERAFLAAVRERPDDDVRRLIFADWLEEHGDRARAEFIRVQCALDDPSTPPDRHKALLTREWELRDRYEAAWGRPLRELGAVAVRFRHGFPDEIHISARNFLAHADQLFGSAPLQRVTILERDIGDEGLRALFSSPHLRNLTALDLTAGRIGDDGARMLASSPYLRNLRRLSLRDNRLGDDGARALAASPSLGNLAELDLGGNTIGDDGARALASSPHLGNLRTLDLAVNRLGDDGARALAGSPSLTNLTRLSLTHNAIGEGGARALMQSPHGRILTTPDLGGNAFGDALLGEIERTLALRRLPPGPGRGA